MHGRVCGFCGQMSGASVRMGPCRRAPSLGLHVPKVGTYSGVRSQGEQPRARSERGSDMTVTTSYGSWNNHAGGANTNLEGDIADIIESVDLGAIVETHDPDNEDAEHGYMAAIGTAHDVVAG